MEFSTNVINLYAPPGTGKSTTAAGLFHNMKLMGMNVELVTEFAKDMVWAGRKKEMANQCYITAKQFHKMFRLVGEVDWIITDSPLLLGLIYRNDDYFEHYDDFLVEQFNAFNNHNIMLKRVKPYNLQGRLQNETESDAMKDDFVRLLEAYTTGPILSVDADSDAPNKIINHLMKEFMK